MNKNCTKAENKVLTEIYRRLNYFHKGNLNESLLLLSSFSFAKPALDLGLIRPYSTQVKRAPNWYSLTEKGKEYFKDHISEVTSKENAEYFSGTKIKEFKKPIVN